MSSGFLINEASRSHTHTHTHTQPSVELFWTSDLPEAETCTWQHTTLTTDIHAPGGIRTLNRTSERPQTHPLDHGATGIGEMELTVHMLQKEYNLTYLDLEHRVTTSIKLTGEW